MCPLSRTSFPSHVHPITTAASVNATSGLGSAEASWAEQRCSHQMPALVEILWIAILPLLNHVFVNGAALEESRHGTDIQGHHSPGTLDLNTTSDSSGPLRYLQPPYSIWTTIPRILDPYSTS